VLAKAACQPTCFALNAPDQPVGASLLAKAACQPTRFSLNDPMTTVGVSLLAMRPIHALENLRLFKSGTQ